MTGGRPRAITPRFTSEDQVVRVTPDLVKIGYLLHDGLVLDAYAQYSPETGKPVGYFFETPHAVIFALPAEEILVYARVDPVIAIDLKDKYNEPDRRLV